MFTGWLRLVRERDKVERPDVFVHMQHVRRRYQAGHKLAWPRSVMNAMRTVALLVFARALSSLGTVHVTVLRQQPTEDGDLSASLPWRWYFWSANPRWWKRLHFIVLYLLD